MQTDRLDVIRRHLMGTGSARLADIVTLTGVSEATVRRDLTLLELQGIAERVHGGVRLTGFSSSEAAFEQRVSQNRDAKRAIALRALDHITSGGTHFLDASTTVLQLARLLRLETRPFRAVTNGLAIAQTLIGREGVQISLLGGRIREDNLSTVGPQAEAMLNGLLVTGLFLGAGAVTADGTICGADEDEANLNARMIDKAEKVYLLVDASKLGRRAPHVVGRLSSRIHVITDASVDATWCRRIRDSGAALTVAEGPP